MDAARAQSVSQLKSCQTRLRSLRVQRLETVLRPLLSRIPREIAPGLNVVRYGDNLQASLRADGTVIFGTTALPFPAFVEKFARTGSLDGIFVHECPLSAFVTEAAAAPPPPPPVVCALEFGNQMSHFQTE